VILGVYFLEVGLQIGFGGFNLQVVAGVALRRFMAKHHHNHAHARALKA
jgi:hypothetical protein